MGGTNCMEFRVEVGRREFIDGRHELYGVQSGDRS